ncbi:MAG: DUF1015 domain-containing protein [Pirellulales bacterium]|nr:DUF1015 domain-containing protein [Pirellulales bacterium]
MPEIQAFRGIRYNLGQVGSLGDVVAPPYDVIGPELQEQLYKQHPCNVVRLILNRREPGDDEADNAYIRAARFLKNWHSEGVLFTEADPAIYVYHQEFSYAGASYTRRGFMARLRLSRFGEGQVFPHEETMPGPKADRLMLTAVCRTNLSQIFALYPDSAAEAQRPLEEAIACETPLVAADHLGVVHKLWPVTDVAVIADVAGAIGSKPIFIADGHHRYETACNYRDQIYDSGFLSKDHPANFVLTHCVAMEDPGLAVLPTHRLFAGLPAMTSDELAAKLAECFTVRPAGEGPDAAPTVWEDVETTDDQGTLALYTRKDARWLIASLTDAGRTRLAEVADDHTPAWRELGVSILHRLIVESLLGATELPKPGYVHLVEEVVEGLRSGDYPLAALVMPATVEHIRTISLGGERMPAKSTYFYPKLLSGLVLNPLQ